LVAGHLWFGVLGGMMHVLLHDDLPAPAAL
jgi:hypothetical protein